MQLFRRYQGIHHVDWSRFDKDYYDQNQEFILMNNLLIVNVVELPTSVAVLGDCEAGAGSMDAEAAAGDRFS